MSERPSTLSPDAPAWYPSTFFEAAIEVCLAAEPPPVAEEAKQAPGSPASASGTVALQAGVDNGSDGGGATDSRGSLPHVDVGGRSEQQERAQIPTPGASAGATGEPNASHTGPLVTPRDVAIAQDFRRAELAEATANGRGSYEEDANGRGRKENGDDSDDSTHAASDPDDHGSELGATFPGDNSSSTARIGFTRGQLWGLGIAALGTVVLVVGLSRRRRTG